MKPFRRWCLTLMTMTGSVSKNGLARVFIDCYAAIPSESIRRLLALREAGVITILALGHDHEMAVEQEKTVITSEQNRYTFDVFIDARGQKPLKNKDLPFPHLRGSCWRPEKRFLRSETTIRCGNRPKYAGASRSPPFPG